MANPCRLIPAVALLLAAQSVSACAAPVAAGANDNSRRTEAPRARVVNHLDLDPGKVNQLSGIAWLEADEYYVVSDKGGLAARATIQIDPETGRVTHAKLHETMKLDGGRDLEDIAIDKANGLLYAVDESGSWISAHDLADGRRRHRAGTPFQRDDQTPRPNLGLESLAMSPRSFWTANEEALPRDGQRATADKGTRVRIQRLNRDLTPSRQYFYTTDPHMGDQNLLKRAQCGVVGLVALPGERLIVMERALGGSAIPSFRIRLYLVDTRVPERDDDAPPELDKTLLAEIDAGFANYEGITLGPHLDNGDFTVLMVSDDGGGGGPNPQRLLSLRVPAALMSDPEQDQPQAVD